MLLALVLYIAVVTTVIAFYVVRQARRPIRLGGWKSERQVLEIDDGTH